MILHQFVSTQLVHKLTSIALVTVSTLTLVSFFGQRAYLELATHFRLQYRVSLANINVRGRGV